MTNSSDRNLSLILAYSFFAYMGRSVWGETVLSAYVYIITDSYSSVGYITGIRGIAQIAFAPVFGWLADKGRRDTMLRMAAFVGYLGVVVSIVATYYQHFWGLCAAMFLWGVYWGVSSPAIDALYADCIPEGQRSLYFTRKYQTIQMAGTAGPVVSIALFWWQGNHWHVDTCKLVMYVGLLVTVVPNTILFWMQDYKTAPDPLSTEDNALQAPLLEYEDDPADAADATMTSLESSKVAAASSRTCCFGQLLLVPGLVVGYDIISSLASGLSIRFFPIFFLDNLQFSPVAVNAISMPTLLLRHVHQNLLAVDAGPGFALPPPTMLVDAKMRWHTCGEWCIRSSYPRAAQCIVLRYILAPSLSSFMSYGLSI